MGSVKAKKVDFDGMVAGAARDAGQGRNLRSKKALIGRDVVRKIEEHFSQQGRTIQAIPIKLIDLGENIRHSYDRESLQTLAASLKTDGLIQFPTLALKKSKGGSKLVCRNGHRRILAAESLGWEKIECVILPFDSIREELYHTINANLRENVFYLDLAEAYHSAHELGESDLEIAKRVGLNQRTVRWYRRLMEMSPQCRELARANPDLFTATWAVRLARLGPLPTPKKLEKWMRLMLRSGRTFIKEDEVAVKPAKEPNEDQQQALVGLQKRFRRRGGQSEARQNHEFLMQLVACGYMSHKKVTTIEYQIFGEKLTESLHKGAD